MISRRLRSVATDTCLALTQPWDHKVRNELFPTRALLAPSAIAAVVKRTHVGWSALGVEPRRIPIPSHAVPPGESELVQLEDSICPARLVSTRNIELMKQALTDGASIGAKVMAEVAKRGLLGLKP